MTKSVKRLMTAPLTPAVTPYMRATLLATRADSPAPLEALSGAGSRRIGWRKLVASTLDFPESEFVCVDISCPG
jgi:hypothetical protein